MSKNSQTISYVKRIPNKIVRENVESLYKTAKECASRYYKDAILFVDPHHYEHFSMCTFTWVFPKTKRAPTWAEEVLKLIVLEATAKTERERLAGEITKCSEAIQKKITKN